MRCGISALITSVMLLVIAVAMAGGYYFWINSSVGGLKESAEESVERQAAEERASISIPVVAQEGSVVQVAVNNNGRVNLNITLFEVFVNGGLHENTLSEGGTSGQLQPGQTAVLNVSYSPLARCDRVRVTGQYRTADEYVYRDDGTC